MAKAEKTINIGLRVPESWLAEIDAIIAQKFPSRTRMEWSRSVVEHELMRQRNGRNIDGRLEQLLANDEKILSLLHEIHSAAVRQE